VSPRQDLAKGGAVGVLPTSKPKVPLTRQGLDMLRGIAALHAASIDASVDALMSWSGKERRAVMALLETLRSRKVLAADSFELTDLGRDLVEGRAVITRPFQVGPAPGLPRGPKVAQPAPAPARPASPTPRDETLPRAKTIGGKLVHPPLPAPGQKPDGITQGAWVARTTLVAAGWQ
jgi:hypothetical protein